MSPDPSIRGLINRLKLPKAMARRIAIADLLQRADDEAMVALLDHLEREDDSRARLKIIRGLGESTYAPAHAVLQSLIDSSETPVEEANAATIARDQIEKAKP